MTKSRKKILLSSIAMLLVALVALGSATYAWFTVSKTVTANDIKVKAIAKAGIEISNTGVSGTYSTTSVSFGQTTDATSFALQPVSWNGTTSTGFIPAANVTDQTSGSYTGAFKAGATAVPTLPASGVAKASNANFAIYKVWVRSTRTNATSEQNYLCDSHTLEAKVEISGDNASFARVKFLDDTISKGIFADSASTANSVVAAEGTTKSTYTTVVHNAYFDVTSTTANSAEGVPFTIIVWFDGEDEQCIDNNQNKFANVTLTFQAKDM